VTLSALDKEMQLIEAVKSGDLNEVSFLIKKGADVRLASDVDNRTARDIAEEMGFKSIVKRLDLAVREIDLKNPEVKIQNDESEETAFLGHEKYTNSNENGNRTYDPPKIVQAFFAGSLAELSWITAAVVYLFFLIKFGGVWLLLAFLPATIVYFMVMNFFWVGVYLTLFVLFIAAFR
jgi:hypothetical protein